MAHNRFTSNLRSACVPPLPCSSPPQLPVWFLIPRLSGLSLCPTHPCYFNILRGFRCLLNTPSATAQPSFAHLLLSILLTQTSLSGALWLFALWVALLCTKRLWCGVMLRAGRLFQPSLSALPSRLLVLTRFAPKLLTVRRLRNVTRLFGHKHACGWGAISWRWCERGAWRGVDAGRTEGYA